MRIEQFIALMVSLLIISAASGAVPEARKEELRSLIDSREGDLRYLPPEEKAFAREYIRDERFVYSYKDILLAQVDDEEVIQKMTAEYLSGHDPGLSMTAQARFIELLINSVFVEEPLIYYGD